MQQLRAKHQDDDRGKADIVRTQTLLQHNRTHKNSVESLGCPAKCTQLYKWQLCGSKHADLALTPLCYQRGVVSSQWIILLPLNVVLPQLDLYNTDHASDCKQQEVTDKNKDIRYYAPNLHKTGMCGSKKLIKWQKLTHSLTIYWQ